MSDFYEAFEREKASDIRHYGKKGQKWGVINKPDLKGGTSAGIIRGMQKTSDVKSMETWDLKDKVERMKAESDHRKLTEEEETYAVTQAEKIRKAKIEKIMAAVQTVGAVVGTAGTIIGVVKSISSMANERKSKKLESDLYKSYADTPGMGRMQLGGANDFSNMFYNAHKGDRGKSETPKMSALKGTRFDRKKS